MVTLTLLFLIVVIVLAVVLFFIGVIGAGALIVFGDLIVAIIVLRVIFRLVSRRKEEEGLD